MKQKTFNTAFITITTLIIVYLIFAGYTEKNSIFGIIGGSFLNISLFLTCYFGLEYFQQGTDKDIQKEIFEENNVSAAIYQGSLLIGIAIIIARGLI